MTYQRLKGAAFFRRIRKEEDAREWIWRSRFGGRDFECLSCRSEAYDKIGTRPEVRQCKRCRRQVRLRAGTIFEASKLPLLTWLRAIYFVMQDKRGMSAMALQRLLGLKSYGTTWTMLHKIRQALKERDNHYKLKNLIELDGAQFGRRETGTAQTLLVGVESKDWKDERGRSKSGAGFAKILMEPETSIYAQQFVKEHVEPGSMVNTDANSCYQKLKGVDRDYQVMNHDPETLQQWLPWVHKFISNAKTWLLGTHHGVSPRHLGHYLAEYTYRFNRRHDPDSLFHRALTACALAKPHPLSALSG